MGTIQVKNEAIHEEGGLGWGISLPVPSVTDLVNNDTQNVPQRYIQKYEDRPSNLTAYPFSDEIPIVDFSLLANGDDDELRKLDSACKEWGFFQITNHGVANNVLQRMKAASASFFELPFIEKKKYASAPNDIEGYGQTYVVSDQQKLDWNDSTFLIISPVHNRNMKCWPTKLPDFEEAVEEYSKEMDRVTTQILASMSAVMGMKRSSLKEAHGKMKQAVRMNYYPTCARPDLVLGVSPHSDSSSITLLLQDDDIIGLQIKHRGTWVPVKPLPNALVVNIGDALEVWSNGVYKSVEHRAVTNVTKARMSIATFVIPEEEVEVGPLETMMDDTERKRILYRKIKFIDYIRYTLSRKMDGKNNIEFLKLENA
ncbi:hypothetical protein LguiA_023705 [Lonicera macranthoides]